MPQNWNVAQVGPFVAVAAAQRNYLPRRCPAEPMPGTAIIRNNGAAAGTSGNAIWLLNGLVAAQRPYCKTG